MQQEQSNFLSMVSGVVELMNENKDEWKDEEEIVEQVTEIESELTTTNAKITATSGMDMSGYTSDKNLAFQSIMKKTFKIIKRASAYAKKKKDHVLLPLVNLSYSDLSRGMEKEAIARCSAILEQITLRLPSLTSFKIKNTDLTEISTDITDYIKKYDKKISAQGEKTTLLDEISDHLSVLHDKMDILDDLVEGLLGDSYVNKYKTLRVIKDFGQKKTASNKPKAKV